MLNTTADEVWDADMVHGCACDSSGYIYRDIEKQRTFRINNANDGTGGTSHALQNGTGKNSSLLFYYSLVLPLLVFSKNDLLSYAPSPEFFGYDCTLRRCPPGDDPKTLGNQTFEVQNFTCSAINGSFTLSFRSFTTAPLYANTTTLGLLESAVSDRKLA